MKALVVRSPGDVGLDEVDAPRPGRDEVMVEPLASGLCGTDLEIIDGSVDAAFVRYPLILGHEWVGRLHDGQRVVVEGVIPDGTCAACRRGATNLCATYDEIGFTRPGALSEHVAVPGRLVHRLHDGVAALDAALVEPAAVVWRALRRLDRVEGARCLVVGDGTVALLTAYLLRRLSPALVVVRGARPAQADLARRAGADRFSVDADTERYDVVVEAAGQASSVAAALASAGRGATVVLLGLPPTGTRVEFAPDQWVNDDLTVMASFSYTSAAWADVVRLLNDGEIHPSFLVTHRFSLDDWRLALDTLRSVPADQARGKVIVTLDDSLA